MNSRRSARSNPPSPPFPKLSMPHSANFFPPPRTGEGDGGCGRNAALLKPSFGCLPVHVLEESGDVIGSLQTIVDHEGVFEGIQDEDGGTPDQMSPVVFVNPAVEQISRGSCLF
jgi:hypothetical protein